MANGTGERNQLPAYILVGCMIGGAAYALTHREPPAPPPPPASSPAQLPPGPPGGMAMPQGSTLPPGHPPLGGQPPPGAMSGAHGGATGGPMVEPGPVEAPALRWKAPAAWTRVPNANAFRLETYDVARQPGDPENPVFTISRSGGDVEANLQRWIAQFDAEGQKSAKRSEKTLAGYKATLLEMQGKFTGMSGEGAAGYSLLGAIVESPGQAYFFKLTGPQKSVAAARADLDAMLAGLEPVK